MASKRWRRQGIAVVAAVAVAGAAAGVTASVPSDGDIAFKVVRGGESPMGQHRVVFANGGDTLEVQIDIDLEVSIGPLTVFEYRHENREIWRDGKLVSLTSETDDDGDDYFVRAERVGDELRVETKDGTRTIDGDILPTSYWKYEIVEAERVLDTQKGEVKEISTEFVGPTTVWVDGREIEARQYRMTGDLKLDLWYDENDQWVKTAFIVDGNQIEYFRGGLPDNVEQASYFAGQESADDDNDLLGRQGGSR